VCVCARARRFVLFRFKDFMATECAVKCSYAIRMYDDGNKAQRFGDCHCHHHQGIEVLSDAVVTPTVSSGSPMSFRTYNQKFSEKFTTDVFYRILSPFLCTV
jgi:hypothetical protein